MNIIGEATNPIEFEPNAADVKDHGKYHNATLDAKEALNAYDISGAKAHLSTNQELVDKLSAFATSKSFDDDDKIASLCSAKKLDLSLDNKLLDGRLNAIVFALSRLPGDASVFQVDQAGEHPDEFLAMIVAYYVGQFATVAEDKNDALVCLMMWDLLCANAVRTAKQAFEYLSETSYLMEKIKGAKMPTPVPRDRLLAAIFEPLGSVYSQNKGATFIVGCQEMPHTDAPLEDALGQIKATKGAFTVYRRTENNDSGNISGFVYSNDVAKFEDVSEQIKPLFETYMSGAGIEAKVVKTTLMKMVVGKFELKTKETVVVAGFHCKSFGKEASKQGQFMASCLQQMKEHFKCESYIVGDMNIDAKWPKGTLASAQRTEIQGAEKGMLPKATAENSNLFGTELDTAGFNTFPKYGTMTTLKQRTQFQGQPEKDGDLTAVHKDYIILPKTAEMTFTKVGGKPADKDFKSNIELLQPSRSWPSDHFAIFVGCK